MSKYFYSNKVAEKRDLQSVSVSSLMGVDYSASMLNIKDYHACDIKNFLKENNLMQKRHRVKQIFNTTATVFGIWSFLGRTYANIGGYLYLQEENNGDLKYTQLCNKKIGKGDTSIFYGDDRFYILCDGNYIVVKDKPLKSTAGTDEGWTYSSKFAPFLDETYEYEDSEGEISTNYLSDVVGDLPYSSDCCFLCGYGLDDDIVNTFEYFIEFDDGTKGYFKGNIQTISGNRCACGMGYDASTDQFIFYDVNGNEFRKTMNQLAGASFSMYSYKYMFEEGFFQPVLFNDTTNTYVTNEQSSAEYTAKQMMYWLMSNSHANPREVSLVNSNNISIGRMCDVFDDVDTYVPTVRIGVGATNSTVTHTPTMLDDINMMSNRVRETFAMSGVPSSASATFELLYYCNNLETKFANSDESCNITSGCIITSKKTSDGSCEKLYAKKNTTSGTIELVNETSTVKGSIANVNNKTIVSLNQNYGYDDVSIVYTIESDDHKIIENCTFGIMYGAGGTRNRLFLSGNDSKPNYDYHTSRRNIYASDDDVDLTDAQDLTYFSVNDYCAYGGANTKVTNYQIMGDGTLLVMKEYSQFEPSVYFRSAEYNSMTMTIGDEEKTLAYETFPLTSGNIGEGCELNKALGNLNNDIVFLNEKGLLGISSTITASSLNSDYRYAYSRSRLVNKELNALYKSATKIATIIYDNKYWITTYDSTNGYNTFVADSRYPYKLDDGIDNEYEYEWFRLDGINALRYFIVDGALYYGSSDGIYRYMDDEDNRLDELSFRSSVSGGTITIDTSGNITFNTSKYNTYKDDSGYAKIHFYPSSTTRYLYIGYVAPFTASASGDMTITCDNALIENNIVYLLDNGTMGNRVYIKETDTGTYGIYSNSALTTKVQMTSGHTYCICASMEDKYYYLTYNTSESRFESLDTNYKRVWIIETETATQVAFSGSYRLKKDVIIPCYYLTKAFNMGQSTYNKFLRNLTIINDGNNYSSLDMGIYTKNVHKMFSTSGVDEISIESNSGQNGFDYSEQDLFKYDFTSGDFPTSYSVDYLLKFNFIQFVFYNNNENNCIVNNLSIMYTYGFKTKGVN